MKRAGTLGGGQVSASLLEYLEDQFYAKVIHSGVVGGNARNFGGRLYVDKIAQVLGNIKTEDDGQTTIESENPERPDVE